MARTKITVTLEEAVIDELDRWTVRRKESRSRLVEEAVLSWQEEQLKKDLIEGYQSMAGEDLETAEAILHASGEVFK